jgi:hypothetical protein
MLYREAVMRKYINDQHQEFSRSPDSILRRRKMSQAYHKNKVQCAS